jgi:hypothetical protein
VGGTLFCFNSRECLLATKSDLSTGVKMDIEPARPIALAIRQYADSLWLPDFITSPRYSQPIIQHVINLNQFRIIVFN